MTDVNNTQDVTEVLRLGNAGVDVTQDVIEVLRSNDTAVMVTQDVVEVLRLNPEQNNFLDVWLARGYAKCEDITLYLREKRVYKLWTEYYDGIKVKYSTGEVTIGSDDPTAKVFSITADLISTEHQAKIIARAYLDLYIHRRELWEVETMMFYPKLFNYYQIGHGHEARIFLCIDSEHVYSEDYALSKMVEVQDFG